MLFGLAAIIAGLLPSIATAQHVFAHIVLGEITSGFKNNATALDAWASDIRLANRYGIEAFVLNFANGYLNNADNRQWLYYAFQAANAVNKNDSSSFKLFFSFDYNGDAWTVGNLTAALNDYGSNSAYYQFNGKPFVSTFAGAQYASDWATVRSARNGNLFFVPAWTFGSSPQNSNFNLSVVDGAFPWNMWPNGPQDVINDQTDFDWKNYTHSANKTYMMGVSPWFNTDYPPFAKAWYYRGDKLWPYRWNQTTQVIPDFVEIVSWNDYGESHHVGPLHGFNTFYYDPGYPHTAWLETLPWQIAAYKHAYNATKFPAPSVASGQDKIVYWYRTSPASQGTTDETGNYCSSPVNGPVGGTCYNATTMLEDDVFALVLASKAGTATISIGSNSSAFPVQAGQNFIMKPFGGNYGNVSVAMNSFKGTGVSIVQISNSTTANYNAWVGCAGACSNPE